MSIHPIISVISCALALVACASTVDESPPPRAPTLETDMVPVGPANQGAPRDRHRADRASDTTERASALSGRLGGTDFYPVSALALPGKTPGFREIRLYDFEASCGPAPSLLRAGNRRVIAQVPWHAGATSSAHEAGLEMGVYSRDMDDWKPSAIDGGRVEVIEAGQGADAFGRVRIEAKEGNDALSGVIYVISCAK